MSASRGPSLSPFSVEFISPLSQEKSHSGKRKRDAYNEGHEGKVKKQAKQNKAKQGKPNGDEDLDLLQGLNLSIGKLDSRLLADYVAQRTKNFSTDLSTVELKDRHVPGILSTRMSSRICATSHTN